MSPPYLYGAAALALALFWGVGVYGRLMRLRAQVGRSFEALWQLWQRQLELARHLADRLAPAREDEQIAAQRLRAAAAQFALAATLLQARPTQVLRSDMLSLARALLHQSWAQAVALLPATPDVAADPGAFGQVQEEGEPVPASLPSQWSVLCHQEMLPLHGFNNALQAHNQAVALFPALLLARLLGFRPGRLLRMSERA